MHPTRKTDGEASRRKFVEPTIVRHGGLSRVTAQVSGGGGSTPIDGGTPTMIFSTPAVAQGDGA